MRLLGLDVGERRIGIAVADVATGHVRALATIRRLDAGSDAVALRRIADEQGATEIVVGFPVRADGSEGTQARLTRAWASQVESALGLPILWRDERHTSQSAETRIGAAARRGHSGGPPSTGAMRAHRSRVDREAAAFIAQAELDARTAAGSGA